MISQRSENSASKVTLWMEDGEAQGTKHPGPPLERSVLTDRYIENDPAAHFLGPAGVLPRG
jgi:hypothetical protein